MAKAGAVRLAIQQGAAEDRRLRILQVLSDAPGALYNENVLALALQKLGHAPSQDMLRNDLMWLTEVLLIKLEQQSPWVAKLTARGADVAAGRAVAYGVAKDRPN